MKPSSATFYFIKARNCLMAQLGNLPRPCLPRYPSQQGRHDIKKTRAPKRRSPPLVFAQELGKEPVGGWYPDFEEAVRRVREGQLPVMDGVEAFARWGLPQNVGPMGVFGAGLSIFLDEEVSDWREAWRAVGRRSWEDMVQRGWIVELSATGQSQESPDIPYSQTWLSEPTIMMGEMAYDLPFKSGQIWIQELAPGLLSWGALQFLDAARHDGVDRAVSDALNVYGPGDLEEDLWEEIRLSWDRLEKAELEAISPEDLEWMRERGEVPSLFFTEKTLADIRDAIEGVLGRPLKGTRHAYDPPLPFSPFPLVEPDEVPYREPANIGGIDRPWGDWKTVVPRDLWRGSGLIK